MARIRTIKPEVLDDHKTARLSNEAWRLWVSALVLADDKGRLPGDAEFLTARIFWGVNRGAFDERSTNVLEALAECSRVGLITVFEVAGERFLEICNFTKHQRIDKPSPPKFPSPDQGVAVDYTEIRRTLDERSTNVLGGIGREGKGMERRGVQRGDASPPAPPSSPADAGLAEFQRVAAAIGSTPIVLAPEPSPEKPSRRKPARQLPADWAPGDSHRAIAAERRVDISSEAVNFRDWAISKAETKSDWDAAFRLWLRRAKPSQNQIQLARGSQAPRKFRDYTEQLAARQRESEKLAEMPGSAGGTDEQQ